MAPSSSLGMPSALTLALMLGVVTLIPASAAIAAPAAVGVSMCLALETQARLARRSAESVRRADRLVAQSAAESRDGVRVAAPLPINGVGAPRWRPLSDVRAALLNIPPPMAIA